MRRCLLGDVTHCNWHFLRINQGGCMRALVARAWVARGTSASVPLVELCASCFGCECTTVLVIRENRSCFVKPGRWELASCGRSTCGSMAARKDLFPPAFIEPSSPPSPSLSQSSKSSGVFGEQDDVHDSASDTGTDAPSSVENRLSRPSTAGGSVRSDASGMLGTGGSRGVSVRDAALAGWPGFTRLLCQCCACHTC